MMVLLIVYLLIINAFGFGLMLADKHKAQKNKWRIPERTLLFIAAFGGSFGSLLGMHLFRHKTQHLRFSLGLPFLLAIHILLLVLFRSVLS